VGSFPEADSKRRILDSATRCAPCPDDHNLMSTADAAPAFLPNLFILGAAKCGTTTFYSHLRDMPDVCLSVPKEPYFFEAEFDRGLNFYRETYFPHFDGEPVVGEARHANLFLPWVPDRIHRTNPGARLIVLLRNPIDRAFSHWVHLSNASFDPLPFDEAIREDWKRIQNGQRLDTEQEQEEHVRRLAPNERGFGGIGLYRTYIDRGYYCQQIERYLARFSRERMMFILFEELTGHPGQVVTEAVRFLGLDPERNRFVRDRWDNPANIPGWARRLYEQLRFYRFAPEFTRKLSRKLLRRIRRAKTRRQTWIWLRDHYREHNRRLEELIGRDLSHWNNL
jgi:hypothetical protein